MRIHCWSEFLAAPNPPNSSDAIVPIVLWLPSLDTHRDELCLVFFAEIRILIELLDKQTNKDINIVIYKSFLRLIVIDINICHAVMSKSVINAQVISNKLTFMASALI